MLIFIGLMIFVYIRGNKQNKVILDKLETTIESALEPYVSTAEKTIIRPGEYEYRCKAKDKNIIITTLHLKMVNRSFIIQWLINLIFKEKERVFLGVKLGGEYGSSDPVYRFDLVPYTRKNFIKQRFERFVEFDDITTADRRVDKNFMVKSEAKAYVNHIVENLEFIRLVLENEKYIEHLGIGKAKEETDPHISLTFEFQAAKENPIAPLVNLFFLVVNQHIQNQDNVKRLISKGEKGKAKGSSRGAAKRGGAKRSTKKSSKTAKKKNR